VSKESFLLLFGFLVAVTPLLGIPVDVKRWIFGFLGLATVFVAYQLRLQRHTRERMPESSEETVPLPFDEPPYERAVAPLREEPPLRPEPEALEVSEAAEAADPTAEELPRGRVPRIKPSPRRSRAAAPALQESDGIIARPARASARKRAPRKSAAVEEETAEEPVIAM
jgi:hypothetical protein